MMMILGSWRHVHRLKHLHLQHTGRQALPDMETCLTAFDSVQCLLGAGQGCCCLEAARPTLPPILLRFSHHVVHASLKSVTCRYGA
jgi:hypothetical protein